MVLFVYLYLTTIGAVSSAIDPTRPPGQSVSIEQNEKKTKNLNLQGIVVGEHSWIVINDIVIREGQLKTGIEVIQIKSDKVLIRHNGKRRWLEWQINPVKKNLKQSQ